MPSKLSGDAYRDYWRTRMARGPSQAGWHDYSEDETERQADAIWSFIRPDLESLSPNSVLEVGSGHGRMLRRLRGLWPDAWLYGCDISPAAVARSWKDGKTCLFRAETPPSVEPDLVFTCTALQHITDPDVFSLVVSAINSLSAGARLAFFENVTVPAARHVLGFTAAGYMACFCAEWQTPRVLTLRGEPHALMIGVRR